MTQQMMYEIEVLLKRHVHYDVSEQIKHEFDTASEVASKIVKVAEKVFNDSKAWQMVSHWYTVSEEYAKKVDELLFETFIIETPYGYVWGDISTMTDFPRCQNILHVLDELT